MISLSAMVREPAYITNLARIFWRLRGVKPDSTVTIVDLVENWARRTPDAPAIMFEDQVVSYAALNAAADRYAHWARAQGISRGETVALLMENRPEYLMAWLGLFKVGAVAALINCNLRGAPLAHSTDICNARHLILGRELLAAYLEARSLPAAAPRLWITGGAAPAGEDLDAALAAAPRMAAAISWRAGLTCAQNAFYIFTSGTTGLPKAAKISHLRALFMMIGFAGALRTGRSDRVYDVLPLYHSAGGICAPGMALTAGGCLVLRRRFSVHDFWEDCSRFRPTVFQYIGEVCRYLLNAPPSPVERQHHLRAIIGNGLRPDIWHTFQTRFAIPRIVEFYGATEGNVSMLNGDGTVGAVGRIPGYARRIFTTRIVRFDIENELPIRDAGGFCIECADNEIGETVGQITEEPAKRFDGYTQEKETEKKILRHVFAPNDAWFRTGDLMKRDNLGYFYFVDRIGDTFRWKGENVATSEVAEALTAVKGVSEANVYGVRVPGSDGRAGMAALVVTPEFEPAALASALAGNLAPYARPMFVRLMPVMEITGTYKQRKVDLVKEGFDPGKVSDPLFFLDPATLRYERLDVQRFDDISAGRLRF